MLCLHFKLHNYTFYTSLKLIRDNYNHKKYCHACKNGCFDVLFQDSCWDSYWYWSFYWVFVVTYWNILHQFPLVIGFIGNYLELEIHFFLFLVDHWKEVGVVVRGFLSLILDSYFTLICFQKVHWCLVVVDGKTRCFS